MKYLVKRSDIIITTADKGGAVVTDTENYIKESTRQLSDENSDNKILSTYFDTKQFHFNSKVYFQVSNIAMAATCPPA